MRISEFVGLTLSDINLRDRTITIDHQLQRNSQMVYKVINTKTTAGERTIPMTDDVYECFKKIVEMRKKVKAEPVIDGKLGFLYLDKNNNRWLHYTGRNIFNISEKNTIAFIRNRCLLLHRMFAVILTALIWLRVE